MVKLRRRPHTSRQRGIRWVRDNREAEVLAEKLCLAMILMVIVVFTVILVVDVIAEIDHLHRDFDPSRSFLENLLR